MLENFNILLELDETNEWVFEIVSNVELKTQIQNKEKLLLNVKPKSGIENVAQCKKCSDLFTVQVFCAHDKNEKDEGPIESIFVKEEEQVLASPVVAYPVIKPSVVITPIEKSSMPTKSPVPVQTKNVTPATVQNKIGQQPRILQPVKRTSKEMEHRFQCHMCEKAFYYKCQLNTHLKSKACFRLMPFGNRERVRETLAYLPIGLDLPNLNNLKLPYKNQIIQADNTITYIQQEKIQNTLWITNFDLFGTDECEICGEPFKGIKQKLRHRRQEHFFPGGKKTCNGCEKLCKTMKEQKLHPLYCPKRDQIPPNLCYNCNVLFNDRTSFKMHLFKEHPKAKDVSEQPFSCDIRNKKFKNKDQLPYLCAHCTYKSKYRKPMFDHLVVKHFPQKAKAKCDMCSPPKHFNKMSKHLKHLLVAHREDNPMHESVVQGAEETSSPLNIERPMLFEHPEARCDQRDKESHQMDHESEDEVIEVEVPHEQPEQVLILDSDGEDDDDRILAKYVVASDEPESTPSQPELEKLVAKKNLKGHLRKVHNPKEDLSMLACDECGKLFLTLESLKSHKRYHLPDSKRPHKCQFCGKGFNSPIIMREHERVHTGEKPYVCSFCQKAFSRKQTFKEHVNTHTGKGYKCEHCERVVWTHSGFRKHLKTHENQ